MTTVQGLGRRAGRLLALGAVTVGLAACEDVAIPVTLEFDRDFEFTWDASGPTSDSFTLTSADIIGDIEIPADATEPDVQIQRLALSLAPGAGNAADSVRVLYSYTGLATGPVTDTLTLDVTALDTEPVQDLVETQIAQVRSDFEAILADLPSAPASMTFTGEVVEIQPTGARLVLDATLHVKSTASFEGCVPLGIPGGVVGPEAECDTGGT